MNLLFYKWNIIFSFRNLRRALIKNIYVVKCNLKNSFGNPSNPSSYIECPCPSRKQLSMLSKNPTTILGLKWMILLITIQYSINCSWLTIPILLLLLIPLISTADSAFSFNLSIQIFFHLNPLRI